MKLVKVFIDDPGIELFSPYDAENQVLGLNTNLGNPWNYPNMANLIAEQAARGIRFKEAYFQPTCSQSRADFQTGMHGPDHGVGSIVSKEHEAISGYLELDGVGAKEPLYLCKALKLHNPNIKCAKIGKGHLGMHRSEGGTEEAFWTEKMGFDIFRGMIRLVGLPSDPDFADALPVSVPTGYLPGFWYYRWWDSTFAGRKWEEVHEKHNTQKIREEVVSYLQNDVTAADDFYLEVTTGAPHRPNGAATNSTASGVNPARNDAEMDLMTHGGSAVYPEAEYDNPWRSTLAAMEHIDLLIGDIVTTLTAEGMYNDTVIMIMGDNGSPASLMREARDDGEDLQDPIDTLATNSAMKGSTLRQGARAPLWISGPVSVTAGNPGFPRVIDKLVSLVDVSATIEDFFGATATAATERTSRGLNYQGASMKAMLLDPLEEVNWARKTCPFDIFFPNGDVERLEHGKTDPLGSIHRYDRGCIHEHTDGKLYAARIFLDPALPDLFYDLDEALGDPYQLTSDAASAGSTAALAALKVLAPRGTVRNGEGTGERTLFAGTIGNHGLQAGSVS